MHIAILVHTAGRRWLRGIRNIHHPQASSAAMRPGRSNCVDHVRLLVSDDVVRAPKSVVPGLEIAGNRECGRFTRIRAQKLAMPHTRSAIHTRHDRVSTDLLQIKHLEAVTRSLRSDVDMVTNNFHVSPHARLCLSWQPSEVVEASIRMHFDESRAIGLTNDAKFPTIRRGPSYTSL
jgi:hypothetical protein